VCGVISLDKMLSKILRIDLSNKITREETVPEEDLREYIGGRGLAAKILFEELKPGIDPLSPDNKLIFAVGVLEGSMVPGTSRYGVFAKSPLTRIWGEAHAAGSFGIELRNSGYIAIVIEGASPAPVYVSVKDAQVTINDASELWGKPTGQTEDSIKVEIGEPKAVVASIGIAGEKLVNYASVISERHRAAGRCGLGTVMGSKRLKAVAVRGTGKLQVANVEKLRKLIQTYLKNWKTGGRSDWIKDLSKNGTDGALESLSEEGLLPTKNFKEGTFEYAEDITGETMTKAILVGRQTCPGCPIGCMRKVAVKDGPYAPVVPEYGGPEYETVASLGSTCCIKDLKAIAKANMLCNMYGVDTISAGVSIGFAMECFERGIITTKDTGGIDLTWGNADAMVKLVEDIAHKRGFGATLALGTRRMAEKFGQESEKYAAHVKGLEIPMHEPRGKKGVGLSYATSNRGACHLQTEHDGSFEEENFDPAIGITEKIARYSTERTKVDYVIKAENFYYALADSLIMCKFAGVGYKTRQLIQVIKAVTGWNISADELMKTGERIFNLCRAFNVREGITRKDDRLPERISEPATTGPTRGQALDATTLGLMLDNYYEIRRWNKTTGIPTRSKLEELGLKYAADELERLGKLPK
jgi:aldehyde:ferredoxin oxidoreductase